MLDGKRHARKTDVPITDMQQYMSEFHRIHEKIGKMWEEINELQEANRRAHLDDLFKQNDAGREELKSIFDIDPNDADAASLDGLLQDYVDPKQNSQELIRFIRDN